MGNAGSSRSTRRKLDQRHDSARSTRFARRAFRSTNDLVEVVFCFHRETLVTPLIETAVPDLVTMLLPPFHMRVGHLLHERGKIAIPLGPNDKMPMVGHQTVSAQPHPASSLRFLNDPLERQKVLVLGEKHSPAHAPVEHVENHPPGECRLGCDIHGFLPRYPSFVNLVAVTFSCPIQVWPQYCTRRCPCDG